MIKAIIIEDEQKAADLLQIMIESVYPEIQILNKCSNLPDGVISIKKFRPDLVFLDIEMPGYSGLQILEFFDEKQVNFEIIFTTAFNDYAIRAFELSAIDYILKPIQVDKLKAAIDKVKRKMEKDNTSSERLKLLGDNIKNPAKRIALPTSNGIEIIKMEDILFLQADGSYTKIILANDPPITVSKNLKFFEEIIGENAGFFRSHRSYLVNTAFIKRVARGDGGAISLTNGDILPITIDRIEPLIELLSA